MADLGGRHELAARRRLVEVLAEIPGTAVVLAPLLQVPPRHIEADRIAEHVIVRFLRVDAAPAFGERDDQFRLVVIVRGLGGIVDCSALTFRYRYQRELALDEEERLLAAVAAHLFLVPGVIAPDAENAPYGELVRRACDRQGGRGPQGNRVSHGFLALKKARF